MNSMDLKNVLIVDDDSVFTILNKRILQRTGLAREIHTAENGQEALDLINSYYSGSTSFPDIILLDLNMPIMDGFGFIEAFQRITFARKNLAKIIVVSSSEDPRDIEKALKMGASHYLTKPVSENSLRAALAA
jgi:CheY-like chemotaxis protein